jgi:transposase
MEPSRDEGTPNMMTHVKNASTEPQFAALIGIDWADQKHDVCLCEMDSDQSEYRVVVQTPEAIDEWVTQLRQRFGGRPVAVCLEQTRGALIYALMKYEFLVLYPINPAKLAKFRQAVTSSGAKDDPTDARLLLDYLTHHREHLVAWRPDDLCTRHIALLVEGRRAAIDLRTQLSNKLKSTLKTYFPQAVAWAGDDLTTAQACDWLIKWPSLEVLQRARRETVRKFYYGHHCRQGDLIEQRIREITVAKPLCTDQAIVQSSVLLVTMLARQLQQLLPAVKEYDEQLKTLMAQHADAPIFQNLPGAGPVMAPRLLSAFGTDRERITSAGEMQILSGIAPVTRRSGKTCVVHRRWACPKFLRQTFHEFAAHSIAQCSWAKAYYDLQRDRGKRHHAAIRALAFKWIRVIYCCWKSKTQYDESLYLDSLRKRQSPLLDYLPKCSHAA